MGTYVVTGSASGMGKAVVDRLRGAGHTVITVDIKEADVVADLATPDGRRDAAEKVLAACGGRLDGAVMAAGLGPLVNRERARLILQVNYFGVIELLEAWRPALAATGHARAVAFSSNSTTTAPALGRRTTKALLAGDADKALAALKRLGKNGPTFAYMASKTALAYWVRRNAVTREWAGSGIRLNAIAPGVIDTPMVEEQLGDKSMEPHIRAFPVPTGGFGDAGILADWVVFMLGPAAEFLCGSVIFVDGGTDAYFRPDDWPQGVPLRRMRGYLKQMRSTAR